MINGYALYHKDWLEDAKQYLEKSIIKGILKVY